MDLIKSRYLQSIIGILLWDNCLKILAYVLTHEGCRVSDIYHSIKIEQSRTSDILGVLRGKGMVEKLRKGKCVHYSVTEKGLNLLVYISKIRL